MVTYKRILLILRVLNAIITIVVFIIFVIGNLIGDFLIGIVFLLFVYLGMIVQLWFACLRLALLGLNASLC
jgi:hypothetical protein